MWKKGYRYEAVSPYNTLLLDVAGEADAPRLAELYRGVKIGPGNYKARLAPDAEGNFREAGGMFVTLDEAGVRQVMNEPDSCFAVARRDGRIVASFWVSYQDPAMESYEPRDRGLERAMDGGRVFHLRELIVADARAGRKIPHTLYYTIMQTAAAEGFTHSLFEIYRVDSYLDGKEHAVGMLNERSLYAALASGAYMDGEQPQKEVRADGFTACVTPVALAQEYKTALPALEKQLAEREITVRAR